MTPITSHQAEERAQTGNLLLDNVPRDEAHALLASADLVSPRQGDEIHRQYSPVHYVYFPRNGVFSLVVSLDDGGMSEAATVGKEGLVAATDLDFSPILVTMQVPGESYRVPVADFRQALKGGSALARLVGRYSTYLLRNANQMTTCHLRHSVSERMCRWLLMCQDRMGTAEYLLTHEFLAQMLGVRRQSVTVVAGTLQKRGLISYRRGVVQVLDRAGLEAAACECHRFTLESYSRIMQFA